MYLSLSSCFYMPVPFFVLFSCAFFRAPFLRAFFAGLIVRASITLATIARYGSMEAFTKVTSSSVKPSSVKLTSSLGASSGAACVG